MRFLDILGINGISEEIICYDRGWITEHIVGGLVHGNHWQSEGSILHSLD